MQRRTRIKFLSATGLLAGLGLGVALVPAWSASAADPLWTSPVDPVLKPLKPLSNVKRSMSECAINPPSEASSALQNHTPVEVKLRPRDNSGSCARIRPTSWLCAMPRYFISEESLNASEGERKFCTSQMREDVSLYSFVFLSF